jgi:hypothetical protein
VNFVSLWFLPLNNSRGYFSSLGRKRHTRVGIFFLYPVLYSLNMLETEEASDPRETAEYYKASIKEGYRGIMGAALGTLVAEALLYLGGVSGDPPLIFVLIGLVFSARHILQIRQAKQGLKEQSGSLGSA